MAKIIIKKSTVTGKVPLTTDLEIGELAVNTADAKLYSRHNDGTVKQLCVPLQITGLTLLFTGWSLVSGVYQYSLSNAKITANSIVEIIPDNNSLETVYNAKIFPGVDSSAGSVIIYAVNQPTADIGVTINI